MDNSTENVALHIALTFSVVTNVTTGNFMTSHRRNTSVMPTLSDDVVFKQNLKRYAYGYLMLAICGVGFLGNVLALTVLSRKSMRSSNTATYLRCLAAVDAVVLLLAIFRYRSYYVLLSEPEVIHAIMTFDRLVQVYVVPFFWIFLGVSSFITLSLSLERYLVIRWPFTLQKSYRVGAMRVVTGLCVLSVFLITCPHFLCYKVRTATFKHMEVVVVVLNNEHLNARWYLRAYSHYVIPIMWYMAPWIIVAVVNTLLALQVRKSSRIRVGVPNSLNPNRNLSILIILIVGVYMVCNFPRCIVEMYCLVNNCTDSSSSSSSDSGGGKGEGFNSRAFQVVIAIADILNIFNSCLNIVIYCVTGARFRRELKQLLLCRCWCMGTPPPPTHRSVHPDASLREVPATPASSPNSFKEPCKELQLALTHRRLTRSFVVPATRSAQLRRSASAITASCRRHIRQTSFTSLHESCMVQASAAVSSTCLQQPLTSVTLLDQGNATFSLPSPECHQRQQLTSLNTPASPDSKFMNCQAEAGERKWACAVMPELQTSGSGRGVTSSPTESSGLKKRKDNISRIFTVSHSAQDISTRANHLM